ncbi:MAG: hypothetical protein SVK08_13505 [Halobacteriota archaeon]|nr:hypothetical protein [Halobacteriota archaeon]
MSGQNRDHSDKNTGNNYPKPTMDGYLDLSEDTPVRSFNIDFHTLITILLIVIIISGSIIILSSLYSNDLKSKSGFEESFLLNSREFEREVVGEEFRMISNEYCVITGLVVEKGTFFRYPEDKLSPLGMTIVWEELMEPDHYNSFNLERRGRTVRYSYQISGDLAPLPREYVTSHIINSNLIFSEEKIKEISEDAQVGDVVKIEGYLIQVYQRQGENNYSVVWPSMTKKWDLGMASSRVIYVEDIENLGSIDNT